MDRYVTGGTVRRLREKQGLTQEELAADRLCQPDGDSASAEAAE